MKQELYSVEKGQAVGSVELSDDVFGAPGNDHLLWEAIRAELANQRQGTACTKDRSQVSYTTNKPWRQKGTGRARSGSRRSPIWVGGGTVFGPTPRDHRIDLPKKMRRRAMAVLFSRKAAQGRVKVVEDFASASGKTKEMAAMLSKVAEQDRVVLVVQGSAPLVKRAARNIAWVRCYSSERLVYKDLFYARQVLITKGALADIEARYGSAAAAAKE